MAKTMIVTTTDDIDGSKGAQTVAFTFDGTSYEIDLSKKNATALAKALQPYIDAGRKMRGASGAGRRRSAPAAKAVTRDLGCRAGVGGRERLSPSPNAAALPAR